MVKIRSASYEFYHLSDLKNSKVVDIARPVKDKMRTTDRMVTICDWLNMAHYLNV